MSDEVPRRRSFVYSRRLNIGNPDRPQSLISYDSTPNVPANSGSANNVAVAAVNTTLTGGAKTIPPVLARARAAANLNVSFPSPADSINAGPRRASLGPIEDLVVCAICLERLSTPKMLQCQHTFCLACLHIEFSQRRSIRCSTCHAEQPIANKDDVNNLPANLYIDSLLRLLKNSQNQQSPSALNSQVDFDSQSRCIKCQTICNDNVQKCRHCKQNFCNICWDGHLNELSSQMGKLQEQLSTAITKIDHKLDEYKDRIESLNNHIGSYIKGQIVLLQEKEAALYDEASYLLKSEIDLSDPLIDRINQLKSSMAISGSANSDQVTTFMASHKLASEIFSEISKIGDRKTNFNRESCSIEVHGVESSSDEEEVHGDAKATAIQAPNIAKKNPLESIETLKQFYLNKTFKTSFSWTKCSRPSGVAMAPWIHSGAAVQLLYVAGSDSRLIYGIETSKGRIIQRIAHDEMIFPNAIACSATRREIFVSDKWKHCVFVFSDNGDFKRTLCSKGDLEGFLRSPEGIAVNGNMLVVCDTGNDRVQCLDAVSGKMLIQFGALKRDQIQASSHNRTVSILADLKAPTSVGVYEDHFIILDSGNRRVKVFNRKGERLSEFGSFGSALGQFKYPEVLAVDPLGFIYVGDGGNTRVQVFQPNGKVVNSFGLRGTSLGKFGWISGVCVTTDLQVIVSDYKNHSVQIFN